MHVWLIRSQVILEGQHPFPPHLELEPGSQSCMHSGAKQAVKGKDHRGPPPRGSLPNCLDRTLFSAFWPKSFEAYTLQPLAFQDH